MKKYLAWALVLALVLGVLSGCATIPASDAANAEVPAATTAPAEQPAEETPAPAKEEAPAAPVHSNIDEFSFVEGFETGSVDIAREYYEFFGIDSTLKVRATGGWARAEKRPKNMPTGNEKYKIGVAMYFTLDDTAKAIVETIQTAADECDVEIVVHDANNDQVKQNEAIENWILEGVDGVIVYPADFYTVEPALNALKDAGIHVVAGNPPMAGEVDSVMLLANDDIGRYTGEIMAKELIARNGKVDGTVIYGTLPTFHPNAVTRVFGFKEVMDAKAAETGGAIEYVEVTGLTQEDFYNKFQDALTTHPDAVACWGVMATTVIGLNEACKAAGLRPVTGGVDMDRAILAGIYNGEIDCTVGYNAFDGARLAMSQIVNLLNGVDIPAVLQRPVVKVTKDNVEEVFVEYYGITVQDFINGQTN